MINIIKFIWHTDEYATSLFLSLCVKAKTDPRIIPKKEINHKGLPKKDRKSANCKSPQAPNLSNNPAKIILPKDGAST